MRLFSYILSIFFLGTVLLLAPNVVLANDHPPIVDTLSINPPIMGSFLPVCPTTDVNFVGLELDWEGVVGVGVVVEAGVDEEGEIVEEGESVEVTADHYELYYRLAGADSWEDRYPGGSQFRMGGLIPGRDYSWYVVSCGNPDCSVSADSDRCSFMTKEPGAPPPPDDGGGGGNGGGNGDGDFSPILGGLQIKNPISSNTLPELITKLIDSIFGLSIVITPLVILYAGFLMLSAAGDATKLQKARSILIWTVVAFAIILAAKGMPNVIRSIL